MSDESPRKPTLKYVEFDLPFVLFLKDSIRDPPLEQWAQAYREGKKPLPYARYAPNSDKPGCFVIGGDCPVFVPSGDLAPCYRIRLGRRTVALQTLRRINPHRPIQFMGEVIGDRVGRCSFSSVRVIFDLRTVREDFHSDLVWFCDGSIVAVNHFIDHYRVIADRPYVGRVTSAVIQEFRVLTKFDDGSFDPPQAYIATSGASVGFGGSLDEELDARLREAVTATETPPFSSTLELNIRDHLDLQEWRLALIETAGSFEAWLSDFLRTRFRDKGLGPEEIDAKFTRANGEPKSVTALAKTVVRDATGFEFSATPEFTDWATRVRDIRNDLVHGKRFDVSSSEALAAREAVQRAKEVLSSTSST